ncbi:hypothetical protein CHS0354_034094 [Potamilus streckersoni]|uniref:Adenosine deaminase domain-containing protein 1 n=1 Tax=Potamilus streckersoni TaxID=2493646 RepID=A0AAE0TE15_9BIVA|nr:hypothetical protein CHS0354_034094 [Potamilus streckersoni]
MSKQHQYIPGLTQRSPDEPPVEQSNAPKNVPPQLVQDFIEGKKQAVSALMEYCSMQRLKVDFMEVPVKIYSLINNFANQCTVNNIAYDQGVGKTKKEAKANAAKIAFSQLLGLGDDVPSKEEGNVIYDSLGRKLVLPSDPHAPLRPKWKDVPDLTARQEIPNEGLMTSGRKDLASILQEFCSRLKITRRVEVNDNPSPYGFVSRVYMNDKVVAEACASSKKDSKNQAIQKALYDLNIKEQLKQELEHKISEEDIIGLKCYKFFEDKLHEVPQLLNAKNSFAVFLVKRGESEAEIVALGSGNVCLSGEMLKTNGRTLIDCYAVTIARRALLKYFHKELKSYLEGSKVLSIFEETEQPDHFRLKPYVTIHLFLSQPPPGDYRECLDFTYASRNQKQERLIEEGAHFPALSDELPGWFSVKNEEGVVNPVEEDQIPQQNLHDIESGQELCVMSCSDKLLQWNVLGLQGSLFSNFLEPVYLKSVILGNRFDHGHLARALCCRLYEVINESLPPSYHLNHPCLTTVSFQVQEEGNLTHFSINWSHGDQLVELVDGFSGTTTADSPHRSNAATKEPCASRLCKAAILFRFREIANMLKKIRFLQAPDCYTAKLMAKQYQQAKVTFKQHCALIGLGNWVKKPAEVDYFTK